MISPHWALRITCGRCSNLAMTSAPKRGRAANGRSSIYLGADGRWHGKVSMGVGPDGRQVRKHVTAPTQAAVTRKVRDWTSSGPKAPGQICRPAFLSALICVTGSLLV